MHRLSTEHALCKKSTFSSPFMLFLNPLKIHRVCTNLTQFRLKIINPCAYNHENNTKNPMKIKIKMGFIRYTCPNAYLFYASIKKKTLILVTDIAKLSRFNQNIKIDLKYESPHTFCTSTMAISNPLPFVVLQPSTLLYLPLYAHTKWDLKCEMQWLTSVSPR